jgi:hypothetical protein
MTIQTKNALNKVLVYLDQLKEQHIWYRLDRFRDALLVEIAIPGERWEVEFFEDGHVEIERYVSTGAIEDEVILTELIAHYHDDDTD